MKRIFLYWIIIALFLSNNLYAQLKLNYEYRPRGEFRYGYKQLADSLDNPGIFVSHRARLGLYNTGEKVNFGISIQDVRVWGDEQLLSSTGVFGDNASLDLHEAWVEIPVLKSLMIKAGRQEFKYDDERLLSRRNWNQNNIAYDAILIKYDNFLKIDIGLSLNNNSEITFAEVYPQNKFKTLEFIHFSKTFKEKIDASVLLLATGYQKENSSQQIYFRGTYGSYISYKNEKSSAIVSGYYQNGQNKAGQISSAYMLTANFNHTIEKFNMGAGFINVSGQDSTNTDLSYAGKDHSFDLLYGTRHRYFGYMDHFSNMSKGTFNAGLTDIFVQLGYKIHKSHNIDAYYHYFALSSDVYEDVLVSDNKIEKYLGSEIDIIYKWKIGKGIDLECGVSAMLPAESLEIIQNVSKSEFAYYGYIMFRVNQDILFNSN